MERKPEASDTGSRDHQRDTDTDAFSDDPTVQELRQLDDKYLALVQQLQKEQLELTRKHDQLYAPLFERRQSILSARTGPGATTVCAHGHCVSFTSLQGFRIATPAVPGFWRTVLQNSVEFCEDIEEHDEIVLEFLQDISHETSEESDATSCLKIIFHFVPNPYFTNKTLEKVYHVKKCGPYSRMDMCTQVEAESINWKQGRNMTVDSVSKKSKRKKHKAKKEEVARPSFFRSFFRNLGPGKEIYEEEFEEFGEEEDPEFIMELLLSSDFERAKMLRDHIIPHAVRWFNGDACEDFEEEEDEEDNLEKEESVTCDHGDDR